MSPRAHAVHGAAFHPLTRQEIERRIQDLVAEVSACREDEAAARRSAEGFHWIAPADLVRRMRPHLVFN